MFLGFSTGSLHKVYENISKENFEVFRSLGCNAIEIYCLDDKDLEKLILEIKPGDLGGFSYVSLHAPMITNIETLELLQKAHDIFHFNLVVIHPDEIESWNIFSKFTFPFAIENMDWKKEIGKYLESMQDIFSKIDAPMVFDVNHCYTNDPSLRLAHDMAEMFKDKIKEIHLSGFEKYHEPLFKTKQLEILQAIPDKNVPIIIESECETIEDVKKELDYIKKFLER
jgi:hypothetical protein